MKAFPLCVLVCALLCSSGLRAQNSTIAPRITASIDNSSLTTLRGNVPGLARIATDRGEAAASTELDHMRMVLSRTSEQQAGLDLYLAQLQDKSSPNYHKWLTPAQFGALYGPADSDVAALVAWLQSRGLTVDTVSAGRTNISFSGTVSQVEAAFHTSIHNFSANGTQFTSNTTDPQIPSALAGVVKGVAHLNTIRPRPQSVHGSAGKFDPQTQRLEPLNAVSASGTRSELTTGSSSAGYSLWLVPGDAATIYDSPNSHNANFSSGTSYTGSGVVIGIGGDATIIASIVETYRSLFLGSSTAPTLYYCTSSTSCSSTAGSGYASSDSGEAYIDTELSGGMAPGATVDYYASTDLETGIEAAIDANKVDIFSLSFGECEQDMSTSDNAQWNSMWQQAAAQGIAVTVSTGDTGSASCDGDADTLPTVASRGLSVSGLASTPYNIAVGGTDFYLLWQSNADFEEYVSTSLGSASTYYRTAKSYIPESTWNDSSSVDTTLSANVPVTGTNANIVAGGGGASSCSTNTNNSSTVGGGSCTSGYAKPSWQRGTGVPADGKRDLPDVSLMAGNGFDAAVWLVCDNSCENVATDPTCTGSGAGATLNCSNIPDGYFDGWGGTSTAAPTFAGILALVEQSTGGRLGQAASVLYNLYNGSHASSVFNNNSQDKVGNNSVPCEDLDCVTTSGGHSFESGYNTNVGEYDQATGLGSVDATKLITYWNTANGTATATVTVTPESNSILVSDSLPVLVTVTGSSTVPTGTVTLAGGTYLSGPTTLSTNGESATYNFTIPAGDLSVGTDTITATYNADGSDTTYGIATNIATETVTSSVSGATFAMSPPTTTPAISSPGGSTTVGITVTAAGGYTGSVTFSSSSCVLTAGPSYGTAYAPTCTPPSSSTAMGGTATFTVNTTAATSAALVSPHSGGQDRGLFRGLFGAGGGATLALVLLLGIPARRRSWRSMLGVLVLMAALGSLAGCGGGGSAGSGSSGTPGTTAGTYTFTVTATGNPAVTPSPEVTFSVVVN
jgi:subtilase family serine protease